MTDFLAELTALAEKATPADILECEGSYPGLVELRGLSFKVSFWTLATDITFEQAQQRRADADLLRALWNHRHAILALGRERDALANLLAEQHEAMAQIMTLRRLSTTPEERETAKEAITVFRKVERIVKDTACRASDEDDDPECTTCGGTGITYQTERRCACQPALEGGNQ